MLFPEMIGQLLSQAQTRWLAESAKALQRFFQNQLYYGIIYFALVIGFTYFYTSIVFKPSEIAENLQKQGGFIPGLRPGTQTAEYLKFVILRLNVFGSVFLGLVAILPFVLKAVTGINTLVISGTGVLILVSVTLETMRQIKAQIVMRSYEIT